MARPKKEPSKSLGPNPQRQLLTAYYDEYARGYLIQDYEGGWVSINEGSLKTTLESLGYQTKPWGNQLVSEIDQFVIDTQRGNNLKYAGPVGGKMPGVHRTANGKYLVTHGPTIIDGNAEVPWPITRCIFEKMLGDEQIQYLYGWLHYARRSLKSGILFPGQALAIAGPKDCGKSLLQRAITKMLGGRMAKPYQYMSGQTPFNADLFGAEHLMIEDESPATDIRARRLMGSMIKQFTVNEEQSCHRKGSTPFMLNPFWRVSITINDEPESLLVLPPIDDSIEDKLILLKAAKYPMPVSAEGPEGRDAFAKLLDGELPGFIHFVETYAVPDNLKHGRTGIKSYHNSEILMELARLSPEEKLLSFIDLYVTPGNTEWTGKAIDLERKLFENDCPYKHEAQKLLAYGNSCATYLGRLRRRYPERIMHKQVGEERDRIWIIKSKQASEVGVEKIHFSEEDY